MLLKSSQPEKGPFYFAVILSIMANMKGQKNLIDKYKLDLEK